MIKYKKWRILSAVMPLKGEKVIALSLEGYKKSQFMSFLHKH